MKISPNSHGSLAAPSMPLIYRTNNSEDFAFWNNIIQNEPGIRVVDEIYSQLKDIIKLENPEITLSKEQYERLIADKLSNTAPDQYGVWVYYPWNRTMVHILDEEEFIRVRTIRNAYKITFEEQAILRKKKIGIIGLSVGQSVAMTVAMERGAGEIRIADFDTLELSNLNRIRTGIHNLGLKKTTVVAREIAEIDPFLKVICFDEGVNRENIAQFFTQGGDLDLLIEECDSVDVKILAREEAKKRRVPVVMDTSDRGMLDIERYDLEPDYPILHGLVNPNVTFDFLNSLSTSEEKLPYIIPILGAENLSVRLKASGIEVGKTITTWPQLGSDVALGGALCSNASRRILLGEEIKSGRNYIDIDEQITSSENQYPLHLRVDVEDGEIDTSKLDEIYKSLSLVKHIEVDSSILNDLLNDSIRATSPGNSQKWKWYYKDGNLLLFIDKNSEKGFADNFSFGTLVGFGCAIENLRLSALNKGLDIIVEYPKSSYSSQLVATINFIKSNRSTDIDKLLFDQIANRCCNRVNVEYKSIPIEKIQKLTNLGIPEDVHFELIQDSDQIKNIGELICQGDRIRLTNLNGHKDFFSNEIRWTREESKIKKDGLDITLFDLSEIDKTGLNLSKDARSIEFLNSIGGGKGFEKISEKNFKGAAALGVISISNYTRENLIQAGIAIERIWLLSTQLQLGFQPYTVLQMLFSRLYEDKQRYLSQKEQEIISSIKNQFENIIPTVKDKHSVFLFRLTVDAPEVEFSFRKPITEKLITR